jgi:hypothetical protein
MLMMEIRFSECSKRTKERCNKKYIKFTSLLILLWCGEEKEGGV